MTPGQHFSWPSVRPTWASVIYQKAEPLLLKAYEGMNAGETEIPASSRKRLADAGARIVALYDAWGKIDKADEWRKRLTEAAKTTEPKR